MSAASRAPTWLRWAAAALLSCGEPLERHTLDTHESAIVRGEDSGDDQNAVVLVVSSSVESWCTASVVASNLLLTARHCLFTAALGENSYADCENGAAVEVSRALPPETFSVYVGKQRPLRSPVAQGTHVYSSPDLDLCDNEIALLRVDTPMPVAPLPMRLDSPPIKGEVGTLVGWGATMENETLPDRRQRRDLVIEELGPSNYAPPGGPPRFIHGNSFAATEGGCAGDSGGPLISRETGAIIGMQHDVTSLDPVVQLDVENAWAQCFSATTLFQRLDQQAGWLRETFREAGAAPWLEGRAPPAPAAAPCSSPEDCSTGSCLEVAGTRFCSTGCDAALCPDGMSCVGAIGDRRCVPASLAASRSEPASACSLAPGRRGGFGLLGFAIAVRWARRRLDPRTTQSWPGRLSMMRWLCLLGLLLAECSNEAVVAMQPPGTARADAGGPGSGGPSSQRQASERLERADAGRPPASSCGPPSGRSTCDAISGWPCDVAAGWTCDFSRLLGGFECFSPPNEVAFCGACSVAEGLTCSAGFTCGLSGWCERICCSDGDCAFGECELGSFSDPLVAGFGYCQEEGVATCGGDATPPPEAAAPGGNGAEAIPADGGTSPNEPDASLASTAPDARFP